MSGFNFRHSRESGNPPHCNKFVHREEVDSRFRGNDGIVNAVGNRLDTTI
ncbi:MAG: hypothetical protein JWN23_2813 [Rhodocyclales bacterium]|nr:hypothetical protein [Rhodocyclales bacterium]